jgi:hypothetical protein
VSDSVGGNPSCIASGSAGLSTAATVIKSTASPIATNSNAAGRACGDAGIDGALARFAAALGQYTNDVGEQIQAASTLALSGSQDLITAGG